MKEGRIKTDCVINIQTIGGLDYIAISDEKSLEFGATAKRFDFDMAPTPPRRFAALYGASAGIHKVKRVQCHRLFFDA